MAEKRRQQQANYYDYNLLAAIILLTCFGLVMLYSASYYTSQLNYNGNGFYLTGRQALISAISFVLMLMLSMIDYRVWKRVAALGYVASIGAILLIIPFGKEVNGATRWIELPVLGQFQPAEVAKLGMIVFLAYLLCRMGKRIYTFRGVVFVFFLTGIVSALLYVLTNNLSTAIIVFAIAVLLVFIVHPKTWPFVVVGGIGVVLLYGLIYMITHMDTSSDDFRFLRVLAWLDPEAYAGDTSFQVLQGLYAIGSGGFWGKGLGNSTQKISWIPEVQNDFIFPVVCEELGVFGALMVTLLFGFLLYRLLFIARNAPDLFGSLLVTGIFIHIALQVILNIAVVLSLIPTTGVTLPFISYGGTSILFLMIEMGLALSVSRRIQLKDE